MENLEQLLPFLIPVVLLDLTLRVIALVDLVRREQTNGPKWVWALVILLVSLFGSILYFVIGRRE
ncbi:MAG: PLD nuclease N-terminal domain-containing protein [Anaerolineae bacterium]